MSDPFLIGGPAVVSFSGGRTSGYMLWRILQAHGGTLPDDVLVCFTNTGREMPGTLQFIHECGERWGVSIRWLEYRREPETGRVWTEEVTHNSASRDGKPFAQMIEARKFLPNPVARFCTVDLKIRPLFRWLDSMGWPENAPRAVGLRADEPSRVDRARDPAARKKRGREGRNVLFPLYDAGITKPDVLAFWAAQPFDLRLAGAWEGNCDGCFLKRRSFIARLWRDHPERAAWWARQEAATSERIGRGGGALFRKEWREGYAAIGREVEAAPLLPLRQPVEDDDGLDRFMACDVGCGA